MSRPFAAAGFTAMNTLADGRRATSKKSDRYEPTVLEFKRADPSSRKRSAL